MEKEEHRQLIEIDNNKKEEGTNMKTIKRLLPLTLALFCILPILAACGGADTAKPAADTTAALTEAVTEGETELLPDLPDFTYDGKEFKILRWYNGEGHLHTHFEFDVEGLNGELLNDALYERNRTIEEQYGVTISALDSAQPSDQVTRDVHAGDAPYQVVSDWPTRLAAISAEGMLRNILQIPYIDIEKPWWDHNSIESYTVGGKLFLITGDYDLYDKQRILIFFFNRSLSDSLGIPNLYETVTDGKWTIDLMNTYTELAGSDLNGDGKIDPMNDQFGMISGSYTYLPYLLFGAGSRYSQHDSSGSFTLVIDNEHTVQTIEKLNKTFASDTTVYHEVVRSNPSVTTLFESGRGLFYHEVSQVTRIVDMDDAFGLIPQPKFDEGQEKYLTGIQYEWSGSIGIPATVDGEEAEMTGVLLEALAALSHRTTYPVFIEDILQNKKAPDKESADMLRMIYSNIVYDIFGVFQFGKLPQTVYENIYKNHGEGFISTIEANREKVMSAYEKVYEQYGEIDY